MQAAGPTPMGSGMAGIGGMGSKGSGINLMGAGGSTTPTWQQSPQHQPKVQQQQPRPAAPSATQKSNYSSVIGDRSDRGLNKGFGMWYIISAVKLEVHNKLLLRLTNKQLFTSHKIVYQNLKTFIFIILLTHCLVIFICHVLTE